MRHGISAMSSVEFFFECSSPWTYLAFHNLPPLVEQFGGCIEWRPILVGGVFNAVNKAVYSERSDPAVPAKHRYAIRSLEDWSRSAGLRRNAVPSFHPASAVKLMRGCTVLADDDRLPLFARKCFESYLEHNEDISRDEIVAQVCIRAGVDPAWMMSEIGKDEIKTRLRQTTQELIDRGGFGSPTMFVRGSMYFGNDALPLVMARLESRI